MTILLPKAQNVTDGTDEWNNVTKRLVATAEHCLL